VDQAAFWKVTEGCRATAGGDTERAAQLLLGRLRSIRPDEIVEFRRLWLCAAAELSTWPVSDAAELLLGPLDDDAFRAAQDWIVSHGRAVMLHVQQDPDSLVALAADRHNARMDWFAGLPLEAHIAATGRPFVTDDSVGPDELAGPQTDLTDEIAVRRQFPLLTAYLDANSWIERPWNRRT
jgi:hypothetical protein